MNAATENNPGDDQPIARFRPLNWYERWLASGAFVMLGALVAGGSCMIAVHLAMAVVGKSFDFNALPSSLKYCANILLALAAVAGAALGRRVFRGVSTRWQVLAYRLVEVFLTGFGTLFCFSNLVILLFGIRSSAAEFVVFLLTFFLVSIPLSYSMWRFTYEQLAVKPQGSAAEIWRSTGV